MDELVTWLRAQLDEDAAEYEDSRALSPGDLHWSMPSHLDRRFLLADVEAKRRILEPLDGVLAGVRRMEEKIDGEWNAGDPVDYSTSDMLLRLLALPYVDRPGYCDEWRP